MPFGVDRYCLVNNTMAPYDIINPEIIGGSNSWNIYIPRFQEIKSNT